MGKRYQVVAPYVLLRQQTPHGPALVGLHTGAIVNGDDIPDDQLQHHLDEGMIAPVGAQAQAKLTATEDAPDAPLVGADWSTQASPDADATAAERPAKSASKADWVAYATSRGMDPAEAEKVTRDDLVARFGA